MATVVPWTTATRVGRGEPGLLLEVAQAVDERRDHLVRGGRDLEGADPPVLVHDDEVAERAADVDAHSVAHDGQGTSRSS